VLHFAAYASRAHEATEGLPWVSYDEAMAHLPQARWMDKAARGLDDGLARLRVHDAETALEAAAAGLGRTLLPTLVARHDPRLRQLAVPAALPAVARELWLLGHADRMGLARISAVTAWLEAVLADAPAA